MKRIGLMFAAILLFAGAVFAQDSPPQLEPMDWNELIAYAINTVVVFASVRLITRYAPAMSAIVKQIVALAGGPLLMMFVQPMLSSALGHPIDLSAIASVLAGLASSLSAMAMYDTAKIAGGR
jgi:hypothetical protein